MRSERSSAADSRRTADERVLPALRQLHWLPVDRRVHFKLCTMMHSIDTGQCPTYSSDMVRAVAVNQMRSGLRSADIAQYIKPYCRTEISKRAFSYAGPLAWNDLPQSLHCITDSKRFRKHLKTHYFNRTFVDTLLCMSGQLSKIGNIIISIIIIFIYRSI